MHPVGPALVGAVGGGQDGGALGSDAEDGGGPGNVVRASGDRLDGLLWAQPFGAAESVGSRFYSGSATTTAGSVNYAYNLAQRLVRSEESRTNPTVAQMETLVGNNRRAEGTTVRPVDGDFRYAFDLTGDIPGRRVLQQDRRHGPKASVKTIIINGHMILWNVDSHDYDMIPIFEDSPNTLEDDPDHDALAMPPVPMAYQRRLKWSEGKISFTPEFIAAHQAGFGSYRSQPHNLYIWPTIEMADVADITGGAQGTWKPLLDVWQYFQNATTGVDPQHWDAIQTGDGVGAPEHNGHRLAGVAFWDFQQRLNAGPTTPPGAEKGEWTFWKQWSAVMGAGVMPDNDGGSKMKFAVACGSWLFNFLPTAKVLDPNNPPAIGRIADPPLVKGLVPVVMPRVANLNFPFMGSLMLDPCFGLMVMRYTTTDEPSKIILLADHLMTDSDVDQTAVKDMLYRDIVAWRRAPPPGGAPHVPELMTACLTMGQEIARRGADAATDWFRTLSTMQSRQAVQGRAATQAEVDEWRQKYNAARKEAEEARTRISNMVYEESVRRAGGVAAAVPVAAAQNAVVGGGAAVTALSEEQSVGTALYYKDVKAIEILEAEKVSIIDKRNKAITESDGKSGGQQTRAALLQALNEQLDFVLQRAAPLVSRHQDTRLAAKVSKLVGDLSFIQGASTGRTAEDPTSPQTEANMKDMRGLLGTRTMTGAEEQEACINAARTLLRRNWKLDSLHNLAQCVCDAFSSSGPLLTDVAQRMAKEMASPYMDIPRCRSIFVDYFASMESLIIQPLTLSEAQRMSDELSVDWSALTIGSAVLKLRKIGDQVKAERDTPKYIKFRFEEGESWVLEDPATEFFRIHVLNHPTLETIVSDPKERTFPWTLHALHYEVVRRLSNAKGGPSGRMGIMRMHSRSYDLGGGGLPPAPPGGQGGVPIPFRCTFETYCPDHMRYYIQRQMPQFHDRQECENLRQAALNLQFITPDQGWDRPHRNFVERLFEFAELRARDGSGTKWVGAPSGRKKDSFAPSGGKGGGKKKGGKNNTPQGGPPQAQGGPPQHAPPLTGSNAQPLAVGGGGGVRFAQSQHPPPPPEGHFSQSQLFGDEDFHSSPFPVQNAPPPHTHVARLSSYAAPPPPGTWHYPPPLSRSFYRVEGGVISAEEAKSAEDADRELAEDQEREERGEAMERARGTRRRHRQERTEPMESSSESSSPSSPASPDPENRRPDFPTAPEEAVMERSAADTTQVVEQPAPPAMGARDLSLSLTADDVDRELGSIEGEKVGGGAEGEQAVAECSSVPREVGPVVRYGIGVPAACSTPIPKVKLTVEERRVDAHRRHVELMRALATPPPIQQPADDPYATHPSEKDYDVKGRRRLPSKAAIRTDNEVGDESITVAEMRRNEERGRRDAPGPFRNRDYRSQDRSEERRRGLPDRHRPAGYEGLTYQKSFRTVCYGCNRDGHVRADCPDNRTWVPSARKRKSSPGTRSRSERRGASPDRRSPPRHRRAVSTMDMTALATSLLDIGEMVEEGGGATGNPSLAAVDALGAWTPTLPTAPFNATRPLLSEGPSRQSGVNARDQDSIPGFTIDAIVARGVGAQGPRSATFYDPQVGSVRVPQEEDGLDSFLQEASRAIHAGKPNACPMVTLVVGGVTIRALLDTGASTSCVGDQVRAETQGKWPWRLLATPFPVTVADSRAVIINEFTSVDVHWNGESRSSLVIHLPGLKDAMLLGMQTIWLFGGCEVIPDPIYPTEITGIPRGTTPIGRAIRRTRLPENVVMELSEENDRRRKMGEAFEALVSLPGDNINKGGNKTPAVFALTWADGEFHPGIQFTKLEDMSEDARQMAYRSQNSNGLRYPGRASCEVLDPGPIPGDAVQVSATEDLLLEPGVGSPIRCQLPLGSEGTWEVKGRPDPFLYFEVNPAVIMAEDGADRWIFLRNETRIPLKIYKGNYIAIAQPVVTEEFKGMAEGDIRRISVEDMEEADWGLCQPESPSPAWKDPGEIINALDLGYLSQAAISEYRIRAILKKYKGVIMCAAGDLGLLKGGKHDIEVTNPAPFLEPARRLNPTRLAALQEIINKGLANGTFAPSNSSRASPIVLVAKKDGTLRMCVDYRTLNRRTRPDSYPLPRVDDILDSCSGALFFMVLDLGSAFWQIGMTDRAAAMAAFITPLGLFQPTRMPMGPRNGPATFQRVIDAVLRGLEGVKSYVDDILLVAKTTDELYSRFEHLLERLESAGAKLRSEKCIFGATKVDFLGFTISRNGLTPPAKHVSHIKSLTCPKSVKECQRFLGCVNFFRSLIPRFADIAKPLTDALRGARKGGRITVTPDVEKAHADLVEAVETYPCLKFPNHDKSFQMVCDASDHALGVALLQRGDDGRQAPIGFMSRRFTPTQERWSVTERELFAIVCGFEHYQVYLLGRTDTVVSTDHMPLKALESVMGLKPKLYRWKLYLEDFQPFHVQFKPGRENKVADYLSRCLAVTGKPAIVPKDLIENVPEIPLLFSAVIKRAQSSDKHCLEVLASLAKSGKLSKVDESRQARYIKCGDLLCVKPTEEEGPSARVRIFLPEVVSRQAVREAHQTEPYGHVGAERLFRQLSQVVYAKGLRGLVEEETRSCGTCAAYRPSNYRYEDAVRNAVDGETPVVLSGWSLDLCEFPHGKKSRYLCVAVEWSTRWCEIVTLQDKTAASVAHALTTVLIPRFGCPSTFITDQGTEFCNILVERVFVATGCLHLTTTPYTPTANGIVERRNQEIKKLLVTITRGDPYQWPTWVPIVQLLLNSRPPIKGDGTLSPFELLYNTPPRLPYPSELDEMFRVQQDLQRNGRSSEQSIANLRKWAHSQLSGVNVSQNRRHNEGVSKTEWKRGDVVFTRAATQDKMSRPSTGPLIVWAWSQSGSQLFLLDPRAPDKDPAWVATPRCLKMGNIPFEVSMTLADLAERVMAAYGVTKVAIQPPATKVKPVIPREPEREHRSKQVYTVSAARRQRRWATLATAPPTPHPLPWDHMPPPPHMPPFVPRHSPADQAGPSGAPGGSGMQAGGYANIVPHPYFAPTPDQ